MALASFVLKGAKKFEKAMGKRLVRLSDSKKANAAAVVVVDRWIQENFMKEGRLAHGGSGWKPLSEFTKARRRKKGRGAKILQDTGALKTRWKHLFTRDKVAVQSGVDYSIKHHKGIDVPQRKITPTQEQVRDKIKKAYRLFVREGIR